MRLKLVLIIASIIFVGVGCAPVARPNQPLVMPSNPTGSVRSYVEIDHPSDFVNTAPFKLADYVGKKVILVDFLTYSCINCIRTFPYLNQWYQKYRDNGLIIVGIHTPEFAFEKKKDNVVAAMQKYGITFPIVMDNEYGTWNAYDNQYWPRKYLIDIHGNIVYDHIGEGGYDETERKIQDLLTERMTYLNMAGSLANIPPTVNTSTFELAKIGSPETYFGAANEFLANGVPFQSGSQALTEPKIINNNSLYLTGVWRFDKEHATNATANAKIIYKYSAKQVNLVGSAASPINVHILIDGKPIGKAAGADVQNGTLRVQDERLYEIVNDPDGYQDHTLEMIIDNPGLTAFTLTFG